MESFTKKNTLTFLFTEDAFRVDSACHDLSDIDLKWKKDFEFDRYQALWQLGFEDKDKITGAVMEFLHDMAERFVRVLTARPELEISREHVEIDFPDDECQAILQAVPFVLGAEYINVVWVKNIFKRVTDVFSNEITHYQGSFAMYLAEKSQHLKVPERIFFHLVEHKDSAYPFAFLATYATKDENGAICHMPLQYALSEYKDNRDTLLKLLSCLNRASEKVPLIAGFVENGEMFHPLRLTAQEAYVFLKAIPDLEESGIMCRIPNWWKKKSSSVTLSVKLGEKKPSMLGFDTLIAMQPSLMVDGETLTQKEIKDLLAQTEGLSWLKGKWVEVDHERLKKLLNEVQAYEGTIPLIDALRMEMKSSDATQADIGPMITNGRWLGHILHNLRRPVSIRDIAVPRTFKANLRPYQQTGFTWLNYMADLGFGACLADDMGLGKTVQVLAYLEKLRKTDKYSHVLLIVPASIIGNWQKETAKFAPNIQVKILHGKSAVVLSREVLETQAFLTITTYGMAVRIQCLQEQNWDCIILDEAQAIKNPATKQTRLIKKLQSRIRIAMTGTPIENDLTNLWSLFDFLNKGLMGTSKEFQSFTKQLTDHPEGYDRLRRIISPFILRRLKSDKSIIDDLPDKMETIDYISLSKKQVVLYKKQIAELKSKLEDSEGIERRGIILATIMKLKQICNHPDQFLGQNRFLPEESGKFAMLKDICETIYEKRERVLVFTQFREITDYLAAYLENIFGCSGFILHGGTKVQRRTEMVEAFNSEQYIPFMILSVKAGGTGLNLTGANHVIHFDRWWNPAVENQATDRAFRIGQKKNVIVHKFVATGTIEERINDIINSKKELSEHIIGASGEKWLTELSDSELMSMLELKI